MRSTEPLILGDVGCLFELRGETGRYAFSSSVPPKDLNLVSPRQTSDMITKDRLKSNY